MKIAAVSTPLRPAPRRAVKSPPLRFDGKNLTGAEGKNKPRWYSKIKFSIFQLLMLTGVVASGLAFKTHNDQLERQGIALDFQHRNHLDELKTNHDFSVFNRLSNNSPLYPGYPPDDGAYTAFVNQGIHMVWDSTKHQNFLHRKSGDFMAWQWEDARTSIRLDESFLKSCNYPLNQADMKELYQRYLSRPDSEWTLRYSKNAESQLKPSSKTLKTLKAEYPEYAKAANGKRNPISLEEFALMVEMYHFFSHILAGDGYKGTPEEIFQRYTETVLAKHAENPKLPFLKPYYENAKAGLKQLAHDKQQIRNMILKELFIKGVDILLLLGFIVALHLPRNAKLLEDKNP